MDFAVEDTAPEFMVGPENHFVCNPDIPLSIMQQVKNFKNLQQTVSDTGDLEPLLGLFDQLLDARSAALFRQCVENKTIGLRRISKIVPWIMEEYGLGRPTMPSSPSSSGLSDGETGSSSQVGAIQSALILGAPQPE